MLELFLVNHPLDCPICDKGGECDLQDYAMAYARGTSDVADPKLSKPKAVDLGPTIVLDEERCIVCQRCVRFDDIIANERQLIVKDRGAHDIIATATGQPYRHLFTGNVTEICPVGALTSKTYRFKSRPWDLERTKTTCTQCSVGCQQFADVRYGQLRRTMLVEDDPISDGWLCDRGRYNIGFYESPDRLKQPLYRKDGGWTQIGWDDAFILWAKAIRGAIAAHGAESVGVIGGGRLTNEEAYLIARVFGALGVKNLDWRSATQRQATPGSRAGTLDAIDRADAIVVAGAALVQRAPVLWLRIQKAVRRGAKLVSQQDAGRCSRVGWGRQARRARVGRNRSRDRQQLRASLRRFSRAGNVHCERTGQRARRGGDGSASRCGRPRHVCDARPGAKRRARRALGLRRESRAQRARSGCRARGARSDTVPRGKRTLHDGNRGTREDSSFLRPEHSKRAGPR